MRAIRRKIGARSCRQSVRTGLRLRQRVGRDHFRRRQLGQILLLLLLRPEQQHRQRSDSRLRSVARRIGSVASHALPHDHHGGQIHLHAAVFLRKKHRGQPQLRRFSQDLLQDIELLMLDLLEMRNHLLVPEFLRGFRDGAMLFGEILRE